VKRPLLRFFLLTFAITWTFFGGGAAVASIQGTGLTAVPVFLITIGVFGPAMAALWLTGRDEGRAGVDSLFGRIFDWKVGARWYVFAIAFMAAIKLSAALVYRVATGAWPEFGGAPWYLMAGALLFSTPVQAGEELGWRGYALPRLASRIGLGPGSAFVGAIWALWHLPLFFIPGADVYGQSFPVYLLAVMALSIAMGWLYGNTGGRLLPVMVMHAAVNQTTGLIRSPAPVPANPFAVIASLSTWLTIALLWIAAAYFLVRTPGRSRIRDHAAVL
jgi:uncharacterized protein